MKQLYQFILEKLQNIDKEKIEKIISKYSDLFKFIDKSDIDLSVFDCGDEDSDDYVCIFEPAVYFCIKPVNDDAIELFNEYGDCNGKETIIVIYNEGKTEYSVCMYTIANSSGDTYVCDFYPNNGEEKNLEKFIEYIYNEIK